MSISSKGLGKGLDALFKGVQVDTQDTDIRSLPTKSLIPNPKQPRRYFTKEALEELAASIKTQGVLQPILVRPIRGKPQHYEIIAGERRWRASGMAGLLEVPVIIRDLTDQETLAVALIENLQREDLNPMEEAQAMHDLKEGFSLSQEDLAHQLGKSRSAIANALRLLALPATVQRDVVEGRLSAGHARALLAIPEEELQNLLRKRIVLEQLTVRDVEAIAAYWKKHGELPVGGAVLPKSGTASTKSVAPRSEYLNELQGRMADALELPVKIAGTQQKGRVSIEYASEKELKDFLVLLGVAE